MAHRAAFRAVGTLVGGGGSECAVIRVESSQGQRYSFKGNANTAESDNCLSAGAPRGSATVCTQSTKLPAVVKRPLQEDMKESKTAMLGVLDCWSLAHFGEEKWK